MCHWYTTEKRACQHASAFFDRQNNTLFMCGQTEGFGRIKFSLIGGVNHLLTFK